MNMFSDVMKNEPTYPLQIHNIVSALPKNQKTPTADRILNPRACALMPPTSVGGR